MELKNTPEKKKMWFPTRKINWILFGISFLIGITGLLFQMAPERHISLRTLGEYLSLSFVLSLGLIVVIGFQGKIKNNFLKALFHAYVSILGSMTVAPLLILPICMGEGIGVLFCPYILIFSVLSFSSYTFGSLITAFSWVLCLLLLGLSLWGIRKIEMKTIRIGGQILSIFVFGGIYTLCLYYMICNVFIHEVSKTIAEILFHLIFPPL